MILEYFLLLVCVLVGVAFITLLERKVLGYIQLRKGPNKTSIMGILQPISDAIKLFLKEKNNLFNSSNFLFMFFPLFSLFLMLLYWLIFAWSNKTEFMHTILIFLLISSMSAYIIFGAGWASNSKYAMIGAYRGVAQTISYEVSMAFNLLIFVIFPKTYKFIEITKFNTEFMMFLWSLFLMFFFWLLIIVAETNRAPFDFAEGESELVSGFNVEYGASNFAFLFLAEYGNIFFLCYFSMMIFFNFSFLFLVFLVSFIIWIRGTYPRLRYDNLMMLTWKILLPLIILQFILFWIINLY